MKKQTPFLSEKVLIEFIEKMRPYSIAYIKKEFSMTDDDAEDLFQDSFLALFQNVKSGKLKKLTSSLSTYFISICRNKALKMMRQQKKCTKIDVDFLKTENEIEKADIIIDIYELNSSLEEKKLLLARKLVSELPSPCNELLWGVYRDNLPLKVLAEMYNYTAGSIKVVKHRCCEKFKKKYIELEQKYLRN